MKHMHYTTTIHFVRHGNVLNPKEVHYGRLPGFPLSQEGRLQALAARERLRSQLLAAIYSSPQLRARETADILIDSHEGLTVEISELLDEVYSPFDGRPRSELERRNWDLYSGTDSKYEQPIDVLRRAQRFISLVCSGHQGQRIVAVTHADIVAFIIQWNRGVPYSLQGKQELFRELLAPGSITEFAFMAARDGQLPRFVL